MWMMNTDIPLSVAFLDEKGVILNIDDMVPHTVTAHRFCWRGQVCARNESWLVQDEKRKSG